MLRLTNCVSTFALSSFLPVFSLFLFFFSLFANQLEMTTKQALGEEEKEKIEERRESDNLQKKNTMKKPVEKRERKRKQNLQLESL
jgi:hypothetical protein